MATEKSFAEFITDQLSGLEGVAAKKMFGEYAVYVQGKLVLLLCDNQAFIKITRSGREFAPHLAEAPPYPGAKPCLLLGDAVEDAEWLQSLVSISVDELPLPAPKKRRPKASSERSDP